MLIDVSNHAGTVLIVQRIFRGILPTIIMLVSLAFSPLLMATASADSENSKSSHNNETIKDNPVVINESQNLPSATGFGKLDSKGDGPENSPNAISDGGGPAKGVGSAGVARSYNLPKYIDSLWPAPGVELHFPNREVRVTFSKDVDSRTFKGQVVAADGNVVSGTDGAPVLFTRAAETPTQTREVIGTLAALSPGTYEFQWSVKAMDGQSIEYSAPFTQLEAVSGVGGSNHRHSELRLPGEDLLTTIARFLLLVGFAFAMIFTINRRWAKSATVGTLASAGIIFTIAFALPAYDSDISLAELLASLEGWAALAVIVTAVTSFMASTRIELVGYATVALIAAQATSYAPRLDNGFIHVLILASALAAFGALLASSSGFFKISTMFRVMIALVGALAPALSVILAAGTFMVDRGQESDLRLRLLAAAFSFVLFGISLLVSDGLKYRNSRLHIPLLLLAGLAISWVTTAPALL